MTKSHSLLTASAFMAGLAFSPLLAQEAPVSQQNAVAEALILAQLQIEGNVDGETAANIAARVVDALEEQGYRVVDVSQTFLGRLRIVAENAADRREVIVSRATGAVLRDRITTTFEVGGSGSATTRGATSGTVDGGITGGLTGSVGIDAGGTGGSRSSTGVGAEGSIGGSVSVGIGG